MFSIRRGDGAEIATAETFEEALTGARIISSEDQTTLHVHCPDGRLVAIANNGNISQWSTKRHMVGI